MIILSYQDVHRLYQCNVILVIGYYFKIIGKHHLYVKVSGGALENLHKDRCTDQEPFLTFVPNTHKLYILRHCIDIELILQKKYINLLTN